MTRVALEAAQLELPPGDGYSKRERVRAAVEGKSRMRLAEISRDIGRHTKNFNLEELGLQVLEESTSAITEITRRDVAKCFGDDLSGERNVVGLVGELFPTIGSLADGFVIGKSLAEEIDQHTVRFPGDWDVEYLPTPHADGSPIQLSELPTSFPGYLIRLKAEVRLEGQLVPSQYVTGVNPTAQSWQMGIELASRAGLFNPVNAQWEEAGVNRPVAGETIATAFDLQGIGQLELQALKDRLAATEAAFQALRSDPSNTAATANVTKEEAVGDLLYAGVLSYFVAVQGAQTLSARAMGQLAFRLPSFGNFGTTIQTLYSWGVPRAVRFPGMQMDIDRMALN